MEINLIVLSLGNSRLAIGTFTAGALQHVTRLGNDQRSQWPARIAEAWAFIANRESAAFAGASVNPPLVEPLEAAVEQAIAIARETARSGQKDDGETHPKVEWVGRDIDLPIKVLTDQPEQTGVDRVLNIAAAYEQIGGACVVVDAGTAITVDCCNDAGEFLGGAIAPGISISLQALHEKTARLPEIKFRIPTEPFGCNTEEAMLQGVYCGARGLVRELAEHYATRLGSWPDVIATGGDAAALFGQWELIHAIAPDLTLYGIALAYTNHHIRHGT